MANDSAFGEARLRGGRSADTLFEKLVSLIQSGKLKEGDALPPEREIVETYGVSRTVAREAVQALANRGLVEARPRFRPIVRRLSYDAAVDAMGAMVSHLLKNPSGVRTLFETRVFVEAGLVRHAAQHATPTEMSELARALHANREATHDSALFYETDRAFHRVLYEMSGNPVLLSAHKAFVEWLAPQWKQMPSLPDRNQANLEAHQAIFDAIQSGDADQAERVIRSHLDDAWQQVKHTFV